MKIEINPQEFARVYRTSLQDDGAAKMFDWAMAAGKCAEPGCTKNEYGCSGDGCLLNFADKDAA
jgi:hypothetical protein